MQLRIFYFMQRIRAERNQACLNLLRRSFFYAMTVQAETRESLLILVRRSLSYAKIGIYSELYNCFVEIIMGADNDEVA